MYQAAKKSGAYRANAYAMTNRKEYWAEGVSFYFDSSPAENLDDNRITRGILLQDDPDLHNLIFEVLKTSKQLKLCP